MSRMGTRVEIRHEDFDLSAEVAALRAGDGGTGAGGWASSGGVQAAVKAVTATAAARRPVRGSRRNEKNRDASLTVHQWPPCTAATPAARSLARARPGRSARQRGLPSGRGAWRKYGWSCGPGVALPRMNVRGTRCVTCSRRRRLWPPGMRWTPRVQSPLSLLQPML